MAISANPTHDRPVMDLGDAFDRTGRVAPPPAVRLWREAAALLWDRPPPPADPGPPAGRDRSILVIPAFLTTDLVTLPLRRALERCGWRAFGWGLGVNLGPTPSLRQGLRQRLRRISGDGPVGVIGVSLGGLMAWDLALDDPTAVRCVITLGSPIVLPPATHLAPLFRLLAPFYDRDLDLSRLAGPLPVRSCAVYSPDDGIVPWQSCFRPDLPHAALRGAHLSLCRNPEAHRLVAEALAPEA